MATKSNGTKERKFDLFKGLISLLCMLAVLCSIPLLAGCLAVILLNPNDFSRSVLQVSPNSLDEMLAVGLWILCAVVLCAAVLVPIFLFRRDRLALTAMIARWLSKIWVEVKLLALGAVLILILNGCFSYYRNLGDIAFWGALAVLTLYLLCLDIGYNRQFFRHNIIRSILRRLNDYKNLPTFEKRSLRRFYSCLGVVAGVFLVTALLLLLEYDSYWYGGGFPVKGLLTLGTFVFGVVGIGGTIWWYALSLKQDMRDWNALMAQIKEMYGGNLDAVNHVPPTSNLYASAMQLNSIRTGIQKAVEEGVKADRTKVELITNVSHDIKTPLTSIISYVELLKKEPDLPLHVMDYITTISRKADRLSHIVQDVFEVSKAATGNISLDLEDLDIGKLLQQTFGEMDETLRTASLTWRVDIPEIPILIHADGQRLYRVFQNLLRNCAQYSLEGSRVYVQLTAQSGAAQVSIRNISKNEITMNGEDLTARFVRGDQNRTTEGSGLGLSIAKSFTEACGGQFSVHTDGDLFLVTVQFPQVIGRGSAVPVPPQEESLSLQKPVSEPSAPQQPAGNGPVPNPPTP